MVARQVLRALSVSIVLFVGSSASGEGSPDKNPSKADPAQPRRVTTTGFASYAPLFVREAKTLDPAQIARRAWKGYLSKMGVEWGKTADSRPMFRCHHDNRGLPWPRIKPHSVDSFDTNVRSIGAHALLHEMLGSEKDDDLVEAGQIAFVLNQTPGGEGTLISTGETAKNVLLLCEHTREPWVREWAARILSKLQSPYDDPDPKGGWMHLEVGWNIYGLSHWYDLSGDKKTLATALACAHRLLNSLDGHGNDGSFRSDGSFGGNSQQTTASWHIHGHTHCLTGLLKLGRTLLKDGQKAKGLQMISQAKRSFDWLYDPAQNPDAGSLTGWLGEWLIVATGWDRKSDCEGCTMGDVAQIAAELAAASRLDPSMSQQIDYYDRAEQIFRGQVIESIFSLRPDYLKVLRECLKKRVGKGVLGEVAWQDQSPTKNHSTLKRGDVQRVEGLLPKKGTSALRFDGSDYFEFDDSEALRIPRFSIYAVVNVTGKGSGEQVYYSNYDNPINWGKGVILGLLPNRTVVFLTTDGTEKNYDRMISTSAVSKGAHIITATYAVDTKGIYADGVHIARGGGKLLDYGNGTVATVGSLREFENWFHGDIAELLIFDSVDADHRAKVESYLSDKYGIALRNRSAAKGEIGKPVLWLKADAGYVRERPEPTEEDRKREVDRLCDEAITTAKRLEGRLLGLCGFPDWGNRFPSHDQDPDLPSLDMMGCCGDAIIRAAHAIWEETVTGNEDETRVNLAFNRTSPHRGCRFVPPLPR